jgi:hypothetical protein
MKKNGNAFFTRLAVALGLADSGIAGEAPVSGLADVHTCQLWEASLTSAKTYTNPYADVTLRVTYSGPAGRTLRAYGFWDGGDTFESSLSLPARGPSVAS